MSYDPHKSGSPYLGLEHDPEDYEHSQEAAQEAGHRAGQVPSARRGQRSQAPRGAQQQRQGARAQQRPTGRQHPQGSMARTQAVDMDEVRNRPLSAPPVPSPSQQPYQEERPHQVAVPTQGGTLVANVGVVALRILAVVARVGAIVLSLLVVANALLVGSLRAQLFGVNRIVGSLVPEVLSGRLVFETPLGGVLRGDYLVCALVLFLLDWILVRVSLSRGSSLARGRAR